MLDPDAGELRYIAAGHPGPVRLDVRGDPAGLAGAVAERIESAVRAWCGAAGPGDDLSILGSPTA